MVFVARDEEIGREVALKEIKPEFADVAEARRRFIFEAEVTASLEHPGIVPIHGLGRDDGGRPFYAMKFIRGSSLHQEIAELHDEEAGLSGSVRARKLRNCIQQIIAVCTTVEYAHSRGVLHRDIKPKNIMIGKHGETLLVDWGVAKIDDDTKSAAIDEQLFVATGDESQATQPGSFAGTIEYASPEQASGRIDSLQPASDIYSLGASLYHIVTGNAAVSGTQGEKVAKVIGGRINPPNTKRLKISKGLKAIIKKAMARLPEGRYASAQDLADDLKRYIEGRPVQAYQESLWDAPIRFGRRHKELVAASFVTLIFLTGFALFSSLRIANALDVAVLEARKSQQVSDFLLDIFNASEAASFAGDTVAVGTSKNAERPVRELVDRSAEKMRGALLDAPRVRASILHALGKVYYSMGLFDKATDFQSQSVKLAREQGLESSKEFAEMLLDFGWSTFSTADNATARNCVVEIEGRWDRPGDTDVRFLASTLFLHGMIAAEEGKFEEAETVLRRVISIRRRFEEDEPRALAMALSGLAAVYFDFDQENKADGLIVEAYRIYQEQGGDDGTSVAKFQRGMILYRNGKYDEAEPLLAEIVTVMCRLFGENHPYTAWAHYEHGRCLVYMGEYDSGIGQLRKASDLARHRLGDKHPKSITAWTELIVAYYKAGRYDDARSELEHFADVIARGTGAGLA